MTIEELIKEEAPNHSTSKHDEYYRKALLIKYHELKDLPNHIIQEKWNEGRQNYDSTHIMTAHNVICYSLLKRNLIR